MNLKNTGGLDTLFIPSVSKDNSSHLMLVLHGLGDSVEGYLNFPQWLKVQNLNYLLINAPDPYLSGYSWFNIERPTQEKIDSSRKLLENLLKETTKNFTYDKIIVFGFSQGGLMALELVLKNPYRFCALIGMSTAYRSELLLKDPSVILAPKDQKILLTHGTEDQVLNLLDTKKEVENLKQLGFNIIWKEYQKGHTIDLKKEIPDLRVFLQECIL